MNLYKVVTKSYIKRKGELNPDKVIDYNKMIKQPVDYNIMQMERDVHLD